MKKKEKEKKNLDTVSPVTAAEWTDISGHSAHEKGPRSDDLLASPSIPFPHCHYGLDRRR